MMIANKFEALNSRKMPDQPRDAGHGRDSTGTAVIIAAERFSLKEGFDLLAMAMAQIDEGILISDSSATILYVNSAFTRITGYTLEEAVGQNARLLKSDQQDPAFYRDLWKTILSGEVWQGELINRRKDGTSYLKRLTIAPIRNQESAISHFVSVMRDVSERWVVEDALFSAERILEDVQSIAPMGSWELDCGSRQFRGSPGFFRIFGWPVTAARQPFHQILDAIPSAEHGCFEQTFMTGLQSHEPFDFEHRLVRRDGTIRIVRSRVNSPRAAKGNQAA